MKISEIEKNFCRVDCDVDLKTTFFCGQCFRFDEDERGFYGVAFGKCIRMTQGDGFITLSATKEETEKVWLPFFDSDRDYSLVAASFPEDKYVQQAAEYSRGLKILRQEPLEALISFIISSNNNIKRIKGIIDRFCEKYGSPVEFEGKTLYAFPTLEELEKVDSEGLSVLRAGFRDKYIMDAVTRLRDGSTNLEYIATLPTDAAREELMKIKGVGRKVADCVLLFGFGRTEVFPKDVWIKRVLSEIYGVEDDAGMFGEYGGIVQQYLFNYRRNSEK